MRLGIGGLAFLPKSVVSMPAPRKSKIETISGDMSVVSLSERSNAVTFSIEAVSDSEFLVNTFYFPGWQAYRDGVKTEFTVDIAGRMLFAVPQGRHTFEVRFEDTPVRFTAETALGSVARCAGSNNRLLDLAKTEITQQPGG